MSAKHTVHFYIASVLPWGPEEDRVQPQAKEGGTRGGNEDVARADLG